MVRRCVQLLCPVCFIAWWIISAAGILLTATPSLAPRLAEFLRANGVTAFFLWVVLLPLSMYLRPPKAYGFMPPEQRRHLNRISLTRLTGRSAISLLAEISFLVILVVLCTAMMFLTLLDIWRNAPGNHIICVLGMVAFYIWWLALRRLYRYIYPT